jgi:serine/threonine protein kinase/tetratricopeptide (TPR) repeat protein
MIALGDVLPIGSALNPRVTHSADEETGSTLDSGRKRGDAPILERGACVNRYIIVEHLGSGGMGVVYKAFDPELGRPIALKLLRSDGGDGHLRDRLLREAQALARLSHPHVVAVHDVGTFGTDVFIAMEFVEGRTLGEWLKEAQHGRGEILEVFVAAGEGLAAAHRAGLVHRDFKPDNVLVGVDGRVRVLDFGLARDVTCDSDAAGPQRAGASDTTFEQTAADIPSAKSAPQPAQQPDRSEPDLMSPISQSSGRSRLSLSLTRVGSIMGTPRFMAPEQHRGEVAGEFADQFSFCVSLYAALFGQFPFGGQSLDEYRDNVLRGCIQDPPPGTRVPRWLHRALLRGLAVSPEQRHPSMAVLLALLRRHSERSRTRWLALGLGSAIAASVALWGVLGWRARTLERAELCQGGPRRFVGVWDDAAKARVRRAMIATRKPYASGVWTNVETTLDRYAARWAAMFKDSCEATRLRGEQTDAVMTLRTACLDRKLGGFSALVDVLANTDAQMLEKSPAAAAGLGSLQVCADVPALLSDVPLPRDPEVRRQIAGIRKQLLRADALIIAGQAADGANLAEQAVRDARQTQDEALLAEALAEEGRGRLALDPTRAAPLLTEAFRGAFSSHLDRVAITAATRLAESRTATGQFDQAIFWEELARAGLTRIGGDDELEADLWSALGRRLDENGKYDDALGAYGRAARLSERRFGADDLRTLRVLDDEITALGNASRVLEALRLGAAQLESLDALLGPQHPRVGLALRNLAFDETNVGHLAEARAHLERAERLYRASGLLDSRSGFVLRYQMTNLLLTEGRMADAAATAREALAMLERWSMLRGAEALLVRVCLARAQIGLDHAADATTMLERALRESEQTQGQDSPLLGYILGTLADAYMHVGRPREARAAADRAFAIARHDAKEGSFAIAEASLDSARNLTHRGQPAEALRIVDQSEPILLRAVGDQAPVLILARRTRGDALMALGRLGEAVPAYESALAVADRAGTDPAQRREIRAALDRALTKSGGKRQ